MSSPKHGAVSPKHSVVGHLTHVTPISQMPLNQRRERLMKRTHTLTSEVCTPTESVDDSRSSSSHESSVPRASRKVGHPDRGHLIAPTAIDVGLEKLERPPHKRDAFENIQMRTRSTSWLIRSRHLFDDNKAHESPYIDGCLFALSVLLLLIFPVCIVFCLKVAKEYERAVVFRLGRLIKKGTKGPGMFFLMPCIDTYKMVDLRVLSFDVPPQEILSRDTVTVTVEAVIYFQISNPVISVTNVNDPQFSTRLLAQTTLRNILGTKTLSEVLQERDIIASVIEKVLHEGTAPWGVKVERVEIKDIRLPHQLMRSMAAEAEAARDARARVIAAEGERLASKSLTEAADVIAQNKVSLHLRYLQTMTHVAAQHNQTIVIPLPMEAVRFVLRKIKDYTHKNK